jgi:hypothetical protein
MFDLKLPDYEIILWINYNDFGKKLEKEILPITQELRVYDDVEKEDKRVYHWIVPSWVETMVLGGKLKKFTENPNMIFLKLKANYDPDIKDVTLKDLRKYKKS